MMYIDLTYEYVVIADFNLMSKFLMDMVEKNWLERHRLSRLSKIPDITTVLIKSHIKFVLI